jgi:hypothetical protein
VVNKRRKNQMIRLQKNLLYAVVIDLVLFPQKIEETQVLRSCIGRKRLSVRKTSHFAVFAPQLCTKCCLSSSELLALTPFYWV